MYVHSARAPHPPPRLLESEEERLGTRLACDHAMESWEDLEVEAAAAAVHPSGDGRHQSGSSPQGSCDRAQALDL